MSSSTTQPTPRILARILLLCATTGAGVLAWYALTRGDSAPIDHDGLVGGLGEIWLVPALYLAAWQLLCIGDLRRALTGAAVTLGLSVATFAAALVAGLFSMGLLALPVGAAGVVVIARVLARLEAAADGAAPRRWPHVAGLLAAYAGLVPAFLNTMERFHAELPPAGASAAGLAGMLLPYVLIFVPHAVLTLALRRGIAPPPWWRTGALGALALALPMAVFGPLWMLRLPGRIAAEHAEHRLFVEAGGWRSGLHAGGRITAAIGPARIEVTVPEGWLGLSPRQPDPELPRAVEIAPDPRRPPSDPPIRRLRIAPAFNLPVIPAGAAGPEHAAWHSQGCTAPDADGLVLCRQLVFREGRGVDAEVAARLPEARLPHRMLARFEAGESAWRLRAPGLEGQCWARESCRLRFAAGLGVEVEAEVPAEQGARWREVREAVAVLVRGAAGLELAPR